MYSHDDSELVVSCSVVVNYSDEVAVCKLLADCLEVDDLALDDDSVIQNVLD